jgi:hypothetical protein
MKLRPPNTRAPASPTPRFRWSAAPLVSLLLAAFAPVLLAGRPASAAELQMTVRVTVERIAGHDFGEDPDFYAYVEIAGEAFNNEDTPATDPFEDTYTIEPNWEFSKQVPLSSGTVPVYIEIRDEDGFLRFDDDPADVDPDGDDPDDPTDNDDDSDQSLSFDLTLSPCALSGDVNGGCGVYNVSGTPEESADLRFHVEVTEPPSAPGLNVRCMHSPLWPQPGDTVTVTLEALDGALNPKLPDTIEIWVNDQAAPAESRAGQQIMTHTFTAPDTPGSVSYGCRVVDEGVPIFTGWRSVVVGPLADAAALPVLYTGSTYSRVDVVFVGDQDDYMGANDPNFLADIEDVIATSYYSYLPYSTHQDAWNFWIAVNTGNAISSENGCGHTAPNGLGWADSVAIIHAEDFRDCAPGGENLFSSEPVSFDTIRHETGHRPFGLADEYPDDGGYYQQDIYPNLYEEPEDCAEDAPNLGYTASDCREFEETVENWDDFDWSVSDPETDDLMNDKGSAQAADMRRINWYFAECASAKC